MTLDQPGMGVSSAHDQSIPRVTRIRVLGALCPQSAASSAPAQPARGVDAPAASIDVHSPCNCRWSRPARSARVVLTVDLPRHDRATHSVHNVRGLES
jgi:hypothetical protein